jgi:hypothetical protein
MLYGDMFYYFTVYGIRPQGLPACMTLLTFQKNYLNNWMQLEQKAIVSHRNGSRRLKKRAFRNDRDSFTIGERMYALT